MESATFRAWDLLRQKDTEQDYQREKTHGASPVDTRSKLPEFSPRRVARDTLKFPSIKLRQRVSSVVNQQSQLETQFPGFILGAVPRAPSARQVPTCQTPGREVDIRHEPCCLYRRLRHSVPLLPVVRTVAGTRPTYQPRANLVSWPFISSIQACCLNPFLHRAHKEIMINNTFF